MTTTGRSSSGIFLSLLLIFLAAGLIHANQKPIEENEAERWRYLADKALTDLRLGRCTDLLDVLVRCRKRPDYLAEQGFGKIKRHDWSNLKGYFTLMAYGRKR